MLKVKTKYLFLFICLKSKPEDHRVHISAAKGTKVILTIHYLVRYIYISIFN